MLVHDIASTTASMAPLRRALERAGDCTVSVEYGSTPAAEALRRAGGPRLGGLTSLEQSGAELLRWFRSDAAPTGPVTVVAHGAGALAVQYALQRGITAEQVRAVVTVGPMWNGTDIGGLGDVEQISRRLGTYDTILRLERPLVDPFCAGCREIVTGSDFLVSLRRGVFPTPGVRYGDIVSHTDGLVSDPGRSTAPGAGLDILQAHDPRSTSDHFGLPADRLVASLVVARVNS
ncbi:esterase/lipase family protein [Williamsia sp. M5A3_1d]